MLGEIPGQAPENQRKLFVEKDGTVEVNLPYVELDAAKDPLTLSITLVKETTPLQEELPGEEELPALAEMLGNARELRVLPERQRPRALLTLLRSRVAYPYPDTLATLARTDPALGEAVKENNKKLYFLQLATVREAVRLGYGECGPLAVAMLYLGKEAGLTGALITNFPDNREGVTPILGPEPTPNPITNIIRQDTHTRLFKMDSNTGSNIPEGHVWAELRTSNGEWIPVDPATELVGDTEEDMETFRDANYYASVGVGLRISSLPAGVRHLGTRDLEFLPGEAEHTGSLHIKAKPEQEEEPEASGYYEGPLKILLARQKFPSINPIGVNYHIKSVISEY